MEHVFLKGSTQLKVKTKHTRKVNDCLYTSFLSTSTFKFTIAPPNYRLA